MLVLKRLFGYVRPYWRTLVVTGVLLLLHTGLSLLPPLFQREIVDQVIETRDLSRLGAMIVALIGVYALLRFVGFGDLYIRHALGERFIFDLRVRIYAHLQRLSLSYFERTSTGELMSRVTNDVNALEQFVTHGVALTAVDLLRLLGASAVLLVLDWRLALIVLTPLPVIAVGLRWFNQRARPIYRQVRDRLGDINARLQDDLTGIRVIQAFGQEEAELERFRSTSEHYYRERVRGIRTWYLLSCSEFCVWSGGCAGARLWGADGRRGSTLAGDVGGFPGLCHLLLRAYAAADGSGQRFPAGHCRRGAYL